MSRFDLLVRPRRFFEGDSAKLDVGFGLLIVAVTTITMVVSFLVLGRVLSSEMTTTYTIDNPDRPPEWVCDRSFGDEGAMDVMRGGCDEPETIEREAGVLFWEAWTDVAWTVLLAFPLGWILYGIALHVTSAFVGGSGSIGRTFAVAAWGTIPEALLFVVSTIALGGVLQVTTTTVPSDPEAFVAWVESGWVFAALLVVGVANVLWSSYVHYGGLIHARNLEATDAAIAAGSVALLALFIQLV